MILTTLAVLATVALANPDPLAPGRSGQVQCYGPDVERKTCESIGSYRFEPDGRIINKAENVVGGSPRVVVIAEGEVYVRGDAECSSDSVTPDHILAVEVDDEPLAGADLDAVRQQIATGMNEVVGEGEYCSTYHPKPDGSMIALVTVAGQPRPDFTSTVLWVRREDGWRLQP